MQDAYQVLVSGTGVTGDVVLPDQKDETNSKPLQALTVRFHVDPNAMPGVRDFRIAAPTGVSTVGQLVIVHDKVVREHDNNDEPASAQSVELPAAICGRIEKAEDVDFFKFHVDGGTTLSFHVRCMRLQDRIHDLQQHADPIIAIRNASGSTVAASDNSFSGDPLLSHTFDQAGDYFLEIRDVRYQGNQYWGYCVEVNDRPFAATLFPLAVNADDATPLKPIGPQIPENSHARVLIEHPVRSG